jgi:hypothetical protein
VCGVPSFPRELIIPIFLAIMIYSVSLEVDRDVEYLQSHVVN